MRSLSRLAMVVAVSVAVVLASVSGAAATTIYLLSDAKILSIDVQSALKAAKRKAKLALDGEESPDKKKKKKVEPDTATVISEGWPNAVAIDTDGKWMYVLTKDSVVRFSIQGGGERATVASGISGVEQMVVDAGWVYLSTGSEILRVQAGGGTPVSIIKGWGGMRDIAVHKGVITIRMGDGRFFSLKGKTWKDKLVSKGWRGVLRMNNDGKWMYLFSGGQVFRFKAGSRGTEVITGLSSNLESMWAHKGNLYFSGRAGRVFMTRAKTSKKEVQLHQLRPRASLIDDIAVF